MKRKRGSSGHLKLRDAATRLGHSRRWVTRKWQAGELEAFKWGKHDVTISIASIEAMEARARV